MFKKLFKGEFQRYGQKIIVKVNSKKKKVNNFNIFFLKFFLSSINFRAKKTITIKGTIIPRTLVAIKIDEESDDKNKFL